MSKTVLPAIHGLSRGINTYQFVTYVIILIKVLAFVYILIPQVKTILKVEYLILV